MRAVVLQPQYGLMEIQPVIEKIAFWPIISLIIIVWIWVMFVVAPIMIETAMEALKLWKELL